MWAGGLTADVLTALGEADAAARGGNRPGKKGHSGRQETDAPYPVHGFPGGRTWESRPVARSRGLARSPPSPPAPQGPRLSSPPAPATPPPRPPATPTRTPQPRSPRGGSPSAAAWVPPASRAGPAGRGAFPASQRSARFSPRLAPRSLSGGALCAQAPGVAEDWGGSALRVQDAQADNVISSRDSPDPSGPCPRPLNVPTRWLTDRDTKAPGTELPTLAGGLRGGRKGGC